jgi:hypothetical protein
MSTLRLIYSELYFGKFAAVTLTASFFHDMYLKHTDVVTVTFIWLRDRICMLLISFYFPLLSFFNVQKYLSYKSYFFKFYITETGGPGGLGVRH